MKNKGMYVCRIAGSSSQSQRMTVIIVLSTNPHTHSWQQALEVLRTLEKEGPAPDNHSYGIVIDMCANAEQSSLTMELYEDMGKRGIWPTILAENGVLKALRYEGRWEDMLTFVDEMPVLQRRNLTTYQLAIGACAKLRRWQKALEYLDDASFFKPGAMTYNAVINACAKAGRVDEAIKLLDVSEMLGVGVDEMISSSIYMKAYICAPVV